MSVILVKHRTVATLNSYGDERAFFLVPDDNGRLLDTLGLRREAWDEMGQPTTITISVEPGDHLNEVRG